MVEFVSKTEDATWKSDGVEQSGKIVKVSVGSRTYSTFIGIHIVYDAKGEHEKYGNVEWLSEYYVVNYYTGKSKRYVRFCDAVKYYHQYKQVNPHSVLYQMRKLADGSRDKSVVHYF